MLLSFFFEVVLGTQGKINGRNLFQGFLDVIGLSYLRSFVDLVEV